MIWTPPTGYAATDKYEAMIGGVLYRNVPQPIVYNNQSLITLSRNSENNHLAASFDITRPDGQQIASVMYNEINLYNTDDYVILEGWNRVAILEKHNGRVWCDIRSTPEGPEYELDISCLLIPSASYPILLHPDRSKFGKANDEAPPNIARLTLTTDSENTATAIALEASPLYLLAIAIENFSTGVRITHTN